MQLENREAFLTLVRIGIGQDRCFDKCNLDEKFKSVDWSAIEDLAMRQGLSAIALDGIEQLPVEIRPSQELLLEWIGEVLQAYEYTYDSYCSTIAEMAVFFNSHGLKMMILKGYACGLDWPKPNHRPCGDIDIWQFGEYKKADALLESEKGIKIDNSHHHHTVYYWGDYMVENHYDFINVHHHKSNAKFEKIFKDLGADDIHYTEVNGEKVYLPSPNLHALFLLRHATIEFAATGISLRQLLDWAFFVRNHSKEVDWNFVLSVLDEFGMMPAFNIFNAICVEDLGFSSSLFPTIQFNPSLKDRVLKEILDPAIPNEKPRNIFKRIPWKIHRWNVSGWKHELCYNESMNSAFWSGVWNHLLKPSSI